MCPSIALGACKPLKVPQFENYQRQSLIHLIYNRVITYVGFWVSYVVLQLPPMNDNEIFYGNSI